jgi:hypothetical protein
MWCESDSDHHRPLCRVPGECLNVHVDPPLLQRLALPITIGSVRHPRIKIHDVRIIRLLEVLLHGGNTVGGWTAKHIHQAVLTSFKLSSKTYGLNQLRYDLRKLKGHGLFIDPVLSDRSCRDFISRGRPPLVGRRPPAAASRENSNP